MKSCRYTSISTFQRNQLPPSSSFMAETASTSETSVNMYQGIRFRMPEDGYTQSQNYKAFSLLHGEPLMMYIINSLIYVSTTTIY